MSKRYYTVLKLGPKRSITPDGFLLCEDVPVARTGDMVYDAREIVDEQGKPLIDAAPNGTVTISRDEKDVFRPEFVFSLAGKPVVNDHPPRDVTPDNWLQYARGTGMNPRRGTGALADHIVMDLIITERKAIRDVLDGKIEISLGYNAEYDQTSVGHGRQYDMIANHIALVPAGRCGPSCAIQDHQGDLAMRARTTDKSPSKAQLALDALREAVRKAFLAKDEKELNRVLDEAMPMTEPATDAEPGGEGLNLHIHGGGEGKGSKFSDEDHEAYRAKNDGEHQQFRDDIAALQAHTGFKKTDDADAAIEGRLEEEAPPGTGDKARKARDSEFLSASHQEAVSGAEILAPGIGIPTYDRAAKPQVTLDSICALRRKALELAYANPEGRTMIEAATGGRPLVMDKLSCDAERNLFRAVVAMKKAKTNGSQQARDGNISQQSARDGKPGLTMTPAELNKKNEAFYSKQA